jgi:hypothetical protein
MILAQQWIRNYIHVFPWYSDQLKSARLCHHLRELSEGSRMVHALGCRSCTCLLHISPFPLFAGLGRLANCQHSSWIEYCCSDWQRRLAVYLPGICTHHISTIPLPKLILRYSLVSVPKVVWAETQESRVRWKITTRECKHDAGSDAACNGRDGEAQEPRRIGDSMPVAG